MKNFAFAGLIGLTSFLLTACDGEETAAIKTDATTSSVAANADNNNSDIAAAYLQRLPEDEVVYFVLPDRFNNGDNSNDKGGLTGDRLVTGYDPTNKGFYLGGDLKGLTAQLDYIQGMGMTAIWLGPIYKNKPVQGGAGNESAGYHGYWITDFTTVDPHFGSEADLKEFIDAAHARGMKIYLDIITNHTADVISYRECHDPAWQGADKQTNGCPYRSKADYPWTTRGDINGEAINDGFMGDSAEFQTAENFTRLTSSDYAYTPYIPAGEEGVKKPAWLNDIRYYHNRGDTTFIGENSLYGDFVGLDDLMTEDPFVVQGFIDIYKDWISKYRIDGFRIDTARHVNPEFWRAFLPEVIAHAHEIGIPNFYVFGEVYDPDPGALARFTRVDNYPLVLDFAFQSAAYDVLVNSVAPDRLATLFRADALYEGGDARARQLPVFLGNHDMGRFAYFLQREHPDMSEAEQLKRINLGNALMFFARGVPVIYYGDEQGFIGDGNDQSARETMFPSQVASFADNDVLGTTAASTDDNFDLTHPIYQAVSKMAALYHDHPTLRRGAAVPRLAETESGGVFALSRINDSNGDEYLFAVNTGLTNRVLQIEVDPRSKKWHSVYGRCVTQSAATGSYQVNLAGLDFVICHSDREGFSENVR